MNQARVDDLTAQLKNGNDSAEAAIVSEVDEVTEAINNPNIDTSALEAEIARNANLASLVSGIYTAPVETPTEPGTGTTLPTEPGEPEVPTTLPTEPTEPTTLPTEEVPTGEPLPTEEEVDDLDDEENVPA